MAAPLPLCYLDGAYLPLKEARISPLDRGFLYADGVYEVMPVYAGRPFRFAEHCARLTRSLAELRMANPLSTEEWRVIIATLVERNGGGDQYVYWQVTRGAEWGRNHAPLPEIARTVFAFCAPLPRTAPGDLERGLACITAADTRWARRDVKSVALLPNVLLRQLAIDKGAAETILLDGGELTEASASAVHVVIGGALCSPPRTAHILPGTTRAVIEELATALGLARREVRIGEADLRGAEEICLSSATRELAPVTRLDGRPVGAGEPGPIWKRLHEAFEKLKQSLAKEPW
ncbi:MAG: D-amino acid aminotransferase [Steroidobacteraceae bacterium]